MDGITHPTTDTTPQRSGAHASAKTRLAPAKTRLAIGAWLSGLMATIAEGVSRAAINRRVVGQLSRMSDRDLKDIGLVRQDVLDSELLLLEGDASTFLIGRREERRSGRRRIPEGHWPRRGA